MSPPLNLNRARKARARNAAKRRADENAAKFGRNRTEREQEATKAARARAALDAHRTDEGP